MSATIVFLFGSLCTLHAHIGRSAPHVVPLPEGSTKAAYSASLMVYVTTAPIIFMLLPSQAPEKA